MRSTNGLLQADVRPPVANGGPGGGSNLEQLFAAGYAACFQSASGVVARRREASVDGSTVTAKVTIGTIESGGFGLAATRDGHLPGIGDATAPELIGAAHGVCPYSNATRGDAEVTLAAVRDGRSFRSGIGRSLDR